MNFTFTERYLKEHKSFLLENMMGPNAFRVTEELSSFLEITNNMRILDLGCGRGLSSILLAEKYGATVFAADLWIPPTENYLRFKEKGLEQQIVPLSVDVAKGLPFAEEYFDVILCVDAYHYFGTEQKTLPSLTPFLKKGGHIAVAVPGLQQEFPHGTPEELNPFLPEDHHFHSLPWWISLWEEAPEIELGVCREMDSHRQAWEEWLETDNPYAIEDIPMMKAENHRYFNHVQLIGKRVS